MFKQREMYSPEAYRKEIRDRLSQGLSDGAYYYYVRSLVPYQGRIVVLGYFLTENQAYQEGVKKLTIPFDVVKLRTRDMDKAKDYCRAQYLDSTQDLDTTLKPTRHTV